jgi:CheY-like chemotaxis protein
MATRILIADDHDHLRAALSELLQKAGDNWSVYAVADAAKLLLKKPEN